MFRLGTSSRQNLQGCHPDGIILVATAIRLTDIDFGVSESLRTLATQKKNVERGVSWTLDSYHLRQASGYAHAWDVFAAIDGTARYDWPLMYRIHDAFAQASAETGIPFEAGINWKGKKKDGPHYQLPRNVYGGAVKR